MTKQEEIKMYIRFRKIAQEMVDKLTLKIAELTSK